MLQAYFEEFDLGGGFNGYDSSNAQDLRNEIPSVDSDAAY
jgi:hypothetical protein